MKIATVGKGGSGKTTVAGTLARILGELGGIGSEVLRQALEQWLSCLVISSAAGVARQVEVRALFSL